MSQQTAPLFDTPQIRAFLEAAHVLGLPIGNMPPLKALNYITAEGHSVAVSRKAREMHPEAFEKHCTMTKENIIAAIKCEAERLKKERPTVHHENERFIHGSDQAHYDALKSAILVFQTMYAAEFHQIITRVERLRREADAQTKMEL